MKRFISIKTIRVMGILTLILTFSVLSQAQTPSLPCCTDFNDNDFHGYCPCPHAPQVYLDLRTPGPAGGGDIYLYARDTDSHGGSSICAGPDCLGDWTAVAASGCGEFCFDVIIFNDACVHGIEGCDTNGGWFAVKPVVWIFSGSVSTLRAIFRVTNPAFITDPSGPNPGWHHICAPIGLESGGVLPSNSYGHWEMVFGTPADWNTLISNVDGIIFPIDFDPNPAEEAGYDNICLDTCPPPSAVPALSEWGLIIFGVVLLGFISWVFLKRRKVIGVR
jgi:hypothetical protein